MPRRTAPKGDLGRSNEPPVLILTSLAAGPKHGYALTKDIEAFAGVSLGPGTLYGAIARLEERGLIAPVPVGSDARRRPYRITGEGRVRVGVRSARDAHAGRRRRQQARHDRARAGPRGARMTVEGYEHLMRWYPSHWRERYGDELAALLEDTYATASEVPLRQRVGLAWSGLGERARSAGLVGWSQSPISDCAAARCWSCADGRSTSWPARSSPSPRTTGRAGVLRRAIGWPPAGSTWSARPPGPAPCSFSSPRSWSLPGFVRFVRSGGWREVSRPILVALGSFAASALLFVILVAWAHSLNGHDRNGGLPIYGWFFVLVSFVFFAALGCGTTAAIAVARRVELSHRTLQALGLMAIALVGVMALTIVSLVAWWTSEAVHAPGFLAQVIGNGMPFQSSVVPPTLLASGVLMVFGLALGSDRAGPDRRVARSWGTRGRLTDGWCRPRSCGRRVRRVRRSGVSEPAEWAA